jgi:shikimate dehydrogenase
VIGGRTALYGLVGWPVGHSLSPAMQNAAFAFHRLDAAYLAMPVEPTRLAEALVGAHVLGFRGLNVTIPHKQEAIAACRTLDETAMAVGAVNTLRRAPDGWEGFNTDATALAQLLEAAGVRAGARVLVIGAGGAARAGAWAALRLGAQLWVTARRGQQAEALCHDFQKLKPAGNGDARALAWETLGEASQAADAVLNATSVGMTGREAALPGIRFRAGQVALDAVYGDTAFIGAAAAAQARIVRGEEMLVRQGVNAFAIWTGQAAPEAVMLAALQRAREGTVR